MKITVLTVTGGAADAKDPLLDLKGLARDIENFKELGINTIRIYTIDNSQNHDEGMKMLDDAGIYLTLDANTPDYSLNRETPATLHASYNDVYLQNVFATIDAFADYNNLLLFFSGNEVINMKNNTGAAPYIKAVTRDMKAYIKAQGHRTIPVGYSAADVAENIYQQALFFDCGDDSERADFFAFNDYSWCDPSDFKTSGWDKKVEKYSEYPVPIFLSEFGCNVNRRDWNEIEALYSTDMTSVYSGGLVYEYTVEPNGYGLVEIDEDGEISPNQDFERLMKAYKKTDNPRGDGGYKKNGKASKCPPADEEWEVDGNVVPEMPKGAEKYMKQGAGKGVGLEGDGSHWAGSPSETDIEDITSGSGGDGSSSDNGDDDSSSGDNTSAGVAIAAPMKIIGMVAASAILGAVLA